MKWYKGLSINAYIDFDGEEEYVTLTYVDTNKLVGGIHTNIHFNESLFPYVYEGQEIYVTVDSNVYRHRALEVIDILE